MADILNINLRASKLTFVASFRKRGLFWITDTRTRREIKAYWDAHKRIFKLVVIMQEVFSEELIMYSEKNILKT